MKVISLFTGAGGLDLGFKQAGFEVIWANELDKTIWQTFKHNFPQTFLDRRSISDIGLTEIPMADGIVGGPPCQSWSEAGALRGINDQRGQLFYDYIRVLKDKQPKFFVAENVAGILHRRNLNSFRIIIKMLSDANYLVNYQLINAYDYGVPQTRLRVIIVGYHKSLAKYYHFPAPNQDHLVLKDVIADLPRPRAAKVNNITHGQKLKLANHEYFVGSYSTRYMARNRIRSWSEPSFTIQAGARHAPLHPQAPKMELIHQDKRIFKAGFEKQYRRLSVRECARIQTFPDNFIFYYQRLVDGYKMVGNAVPVKLAQLLAQSIINDLDDKKERKVRLSKHHKIQTSLI